MKERSVVELHWQGVGGWQANVISLQTSSAWECICSKHVTAHSPTVLCMCIYRSSETNNFHKLIAECCPEYKVHVIPHSEMHGYSHGYLKSAAVSQLLHKQIDLLQWGNYRDQSWIWQLEISTRPSPCQPLTASLQQTCHYTQKTQDGGV